MRLFQIAMPFVVSILFMTACGGGSTQPSAPSQSRPQSTMSASAFEDLSLQTALNAPAIATTSVTVPQLHTMAQVPSKPEIVTAASTSEPRILATLIETGVNQTGVPCSNCVSGAQTSANVGLTYPLSYVPAGDSSLQYVMLFSDRNVNATCNFSITVTAGTTVLFNAPSSFALSAGEMSSIGTGGPRPTYTGPATLLGKIACPGVAVTSVKVSLYFQ